MEDVPKPQGLQLRRSGYYFRIRIPEDVRKHYETNEIVRSLGTRDYKSAVRQLKFTAAKIEAEFEVYRLRSLSAEAAKPIELNRDQAFKLALLWFTTENRNIAAQDEAVQPAALDQTLDNLDEDIFPLT